MWLVTLKTGFSTERWEKLEADWLSWWNHDLDRPMVVMERFVPSEKISSASELNPGVWCTAHFPLEMAACEAVDICQEYIECAKHYGDSWPRWWANFGPGIIAGFLGSQVKVSSHTVWFEPPEGFSFDDFDPRFDANNVWFRRIMDLTEAALEKWGDQVNICMTDIGGNFDILASFRTSEKLLTDLYDCPDKIEVLLKKTTELWVKYYQEFYAKTSSNHRGSSAWTGLWAPGKMYIMQSDFSYMISPDMFERYVMPDLVSCCDYLDYSFYHLDGTGQIPHLEHLLSIENLGGIQWIPGDGSGQPEDYMDLLKRIIDGGKLCQMYVRPEGALKIKEELGGKGFAFQIIVDDMDDGAANDLVKRLYQ